VPLQDLLKTFHGNVDFDFQTQQGASRGFYEFLQLGVFLQVAAEHLRLPVSRQLNDPPHGRHGHGLPKIRRLVGTIVDQEGGPGIGG
jgi:hypothetical protein